MLTEAEKKAILDQNDNDPVLQKYIQKVFIEAPMLTNSVHIEGLAVQYMKAVEYGKKKNIPFADVVKLYERVYAEDAQILKAFGQEMPPLELDLSKFEEPYKLNEELTATAIEAQKKLSNLVDAAKQFQETGMLFDPDDEAERFFGTVVNEETVKKVQRANELLDIIELGSLDVEIEKFKEPDPHVRSAIAVMTVNGVNNLESTTLIAFRELVESADDITFTPKDDQICRISFSFKNLWKKHRLMTEEEFEEYWNSLEEEEE